LKKGDVIHFWSGSKIRRGEVLGFKPATDRWGQEIEGREVIVDVQHFGEWWIFEETLDKNLIE